MTQPLPMPIRVLVKGASTVNWLSEMGGPRTDFAFPRAIEAELLGAGRPVQIRTISVPSERTSTTLRRWEDEVLGYSPDVVVLVYGHYETIHLFLPRWLERHANSLRTRPRPLVNLYRKSVLRAVWMFLARMQARLDTRLDPTLRRARPRNVANDLQTLITQLQKIGSPLVIVFELLPPAKRYRSWFPGMAARIDVMNEAIAAMIKRVDKPNVRLFRTSEMVTKYAEGDIDVATPDGFHYSPYLHKMIGAELGRQIMEWADTQPHLQVGAPRAGSPR
jgi:hypothetical protein